MEEVRAGPISQAPFGVAKFGAMAFANLVTDKVEGPLDVARCQTEASNSLGASPGSEIEC
jgi:hypothetical protein